MVSGLNINLAKSENFQLGRVYDIESLARILECKIGTLTLVYLGLALGASFKSKVTMRLKSWKTLLHSKGGRLTIIKLSIASIPNYFLSLFTILVSVSKRIEAEFRDFLWNDILDHHHYHLVNWNTICSLIGNGGSGIRNLRFTIGCC